MPHQGNKDAAKFVRQTNEEVLTGSPADRRYRRVLAKRPVRFVLPAGVQRNGTLIDASIRGVSVATKPGAIVGDEVELYIGDLGHLKGRVAGLHERGFGVTLSATKEQRIFLADALTVMLNAALVDDRPMRFAIGEETNLETLEGHIAHSRIVDLSGTGAQLITALQPTTGDRVLVGRKRATVVRVFEGGVGVSFVRGTPQKSE